MPLNRKRMKRDSESVVLIFDNVESREKKVFTVKESAFRVSSPVFDVMLKTNAFKEGFNKESKLLGINVKVAPYFVRFLETGSILDAKMSEEDLYELFKSSHLYQITSLFEECETLIRRTLTLNNLVTVLTKVEMFSPDLCKEIIRLIRRAAFILFDDRSDIGLLSEEQMKDLLDSEDLNVLDEEQAFNALVKWGETRCSQERKNPTKTNMTKVLKNLLPLIRWSHFPSSSKLDRKWQNLVKDKIKKNPIRNTVRSRTLTAIDSQTSLIRYSKRFVLSMVGDYDKKFDQFTSEKLEMEPSQLITFTMDFDAYIVGFKSYFIVPKYGVSKLFSLRAAVLTEERTFYLLGYLKSKQCREANSEKDNQVLCSVTFESNFILVKKGSIQAFCCCKTRKFPKVLFPVSMKPAKFFKGNAKFTDSESNVLTLTNNNVHGVNKIFYFPA